MLNDCLKKINFYLICFYLKKEDKKQRDVSASMLLLTFLCRQFKRIEIKTKVD